MRPSRLRRSGVTLIELTLVTLLLLTLVGLSIPLFKRTFSDLAVKDTSFSISKLINYAQEMAVLERNNYMISFDFQKGRYQLSGINTSVKPPVYKKVSGRFGKLFGLPQGVSISGTKKAAVFYPDGHCDGFQVNVLSKTGGYSVIVNRFGNSVEIKEAKVER